MLTAEGEQFIRQVRLHLAMIEKVRRSLWSVPSALIYQACMVVGLGGAGAGTFAEPEGRPMELLHTEPPYDAVVDSDRGRDARRDHKPPFAATAIDHAASDAPRSVLFDGRSLCTGSASRRRSAGVSNRSVWL